LKFSYNIPLPVEAAEDAPWKGFNSSETVGVILTRKVKQPPLVLQEPVEAIVPPPPLAYPIRIPVVIQSKQAQSLPQVEEVVEKPPPDQNQ